MLVSQSVRIAAAGWLLCASIQPTAALLQSTETYRRLIDLTYLSTPKPDGFQGKPTPDLTASGGVGIVYPGWIFSPRYR